MKIKSFRAVIPKMNFVASPKAFFSSVKEKYPDYRRGEFFKKTSQEAIYIYQIAKNGEINTGIITTVHVKEFISNRIKKHENTLKAKEQQQIDLMLKRKAVVKPILVFYNAEKKINTLIKKCIKTYEKILDITLDDTDEVHRIWEVTDGTDVEKFITLFKNIVSEGYIADGHHRVAADSLMYKRLKEEKSLDNPYEYLMTAFFPSTELQIYDFNRVIDASNNISATKFLVALSKVCDIDILEKPSRPKKKFELCLCIGEEWYKLTWKKEALKKIGKKTVLLDATILNELVLETILDIKDVRADTRIKYVEGVIEIDQFVANCKKNEISFGFLLYPVEIEDLIKVADKKMVMPPKSTWFEPRMKNGLLVQEL